MAVIISITQNPPEQCLICLGEDSSVREINHDDCAMKVHPVCLSQWLNREQKCLICKKDCQPDVVEPYLSLTDRTVVHLRPLAPLISGMMKGFFAGLAIPPAYAFLSQQPMNGRLFARSLEYGAVTSLGLGTISSLLRSVEEYHENNPSLDTRVLRAGATLGASIIGICAGFLLTLSNQS